MNFISNLQGNILIGSLNCIFKRKYNGFNDLTVSSADGGERYRLYDTRCCVEQDTKKVFQHPQSKHFSKCYTYSSSVFTPKEDNAPVLGLAPELTDSKKRHFPEKQGQSGNYK